MNLINLRFDRDLISLDSLNNNLHTLYLHKGISKAKVRAASASVHAGSLFIKNKYKFQNLNTKDL